MFQSVNISQIWLIVLSFVLSFIQFICQHIFGRVVLTPSILQIGQDGFILKRYLVVISCTLVINIILCQQILVFAGVILLI